jgi:hypothetical protein
MSPEEAFCRRWAALPDRPDLDEDELSLFLDWLAENGPDEWHRWATNANWDYGTDLMRWVIDQESCDKGTALSVYYAAQPDYWAQYDTVEAARADVSGETVELMVAICEHWAAGRYRTYDFQPDVVALEYLQQGPEAMRALADELPWSVPDDMAAAPIQGVPTEFEGAVIDGIPIAMLRAIKAAGLDPDGPDWD